ncbi:OmpA family protein [Ferruginibacter paludis]|uniref:OmpA family protein n=1 Tax=Ferruginibacter paludis TaxID=1310417 RepID=UPI0025B353DE|nr:OmpA family protein [Ferruginibacter paludis]MDN3656903.1 OmpA family protein [Ferruginibacter paludis]
MKKRISFLLLAIIPFLAQAQFGGLLGKVKNKVSDKVNQRVDNKMDKAIDKTLDKAEGKEAATQPEAASTAAVGNEKSTIKSISKYDFVPGEKVFFAEDFAQEAIGELPVNWNTSGSGEVVSLEKFPSKWLQVHNPFIYLTSNTKELTENYTAEFDLILQLKNNGWMYPTFSSGFIATNGEPGTDNVFLKDYNKYAAVVATISPAEYKDSRVSLESFTDAKKYFKSEDKIYSDLENYYGKPVHVAIQVQKQRFRMWINETKVFDVPKGLDTAYKMNQLFFKVGATNYKEDQYAIFIGNIKAATGLPDTRHKLIEEGKFSTTGILFNLNSATIQPASFGVLKEIADVLKENPSIKIKVIGHTSSDGDDKVNMELSKKRAAAVKDMLVNDFKLDASIIETDGKGESQPVADNKTKEGKAQNRRVEFIKL